ncbi:MAG: polymerase [Synechococcales cyanobacterium RU_4_20]|nr:polymerase [Synechococcales cyanobacterium RU_4_20]NJR67413.1 polymerase [Synechococcales cyanobacterium CRU_2_2]
MWNPLLEHSEPEPGRGWAWRCTQLGVFFLPFIPVLGALLLVASSARSTYCHGARMLARPLNRGFALLGALMLLVSLWGEYRGEALLGLVHFLPYFWLLAAQTELTGQPQQLRQLAQIIALSAVPLVTIGLGELYLGWSAPLLWGGILPWPVSAFGTPPGRMASLFGYANNLALYLCVAFVMALGLWSAHWRTRQLKPLALWTVVACISTLGIILTQSRSAWGLMALSALVTALYLRWTLVVGAVMGFAAAVLGAAFSPVGQAPLRQMIPSFLWTRLTDQNFPDRPLPTLRITQWRFTLDLMRQRPLQGWGLRNFTPLYEAHTQVWMGHPHNLFLMLGAEIGLPLTFF